MPLGLGLRIGTTFAFLVKANHKAGLKLKKKSNSQLERDSYQ